MKKIIVFVLLGLLVLSLIGCNSNPATEVTSSPSTLSSQNEMEGQTQDQPSSQNQTQSTTQSAAQPNQQTVQEDKSNTTAAQPSVSGEQTVAAAITKEKAKSIALNHANLKESVVKGLEAERDFERTTPVFEVEFRQGANKYEYKIHGETGKILSAEKNDVNILVSSNASVISKEKAQSVALSHAKLSADAVGDLQVELDTENGVQVYEVEFEYQNYEYHYTVNAQNGNILNHYKSLD